MTYQTFPLKSMCLSLLMAACSFSAFAQNASMSPEPVAMNTKPGKAVFFRNVVLDNNRTGSLPFTTTVTGLIKGRLLLESAAIQAVDPQGVGGVRMILRANADGGEIIVGHRITDANGKYDFENLQPGEYWIEVDPVSIPASLRRSGGFVSTVGFEATLATNVNAAAPSQRSITGIVFIDKDGDGRYKAWKDELVSGAYITANGRFAVTEADGSYTLRDLPAGRTGVLVSLPATNDNAHLVLDLGTGTATNRVVNVPMSR